MGGEIKGYVGAGRGKLTRPERLQTFLTSYLPLQLQLLIPSTADPNFQSTFLTKIR